MAQKSLATRGSILTNFTDTNLTFIDYLKRSKVSSALTLSSTLAYVSHSCPLSYVVFSSSNIERQVTLASHCILLIYLLYGKDQTPIFTTWAPQISLTLWSKDLPDKLTVILQTPRNPKSVFYPPSPHPPMTSSITQNYYTSNQQIHTTLFKLHLL
jgi:hypothetical protein